MKNIPTATRSYNRRGRNVANIGSDYTEHEVEFLKAVDGYKRNTGRAFPTCTEILALLKSLGY